jgi:hypothetical protein
MSAGKNARLLLKDRILYAKRAEFIARGFDRPGTFGFQTRASIDLLEELYGTKGLSTRPMSWEDKVAKAAEVISFDDPPLETFMEKHLPRAWKETGDFYSNPKKKRKGCTTHIDMPLAHAHIDYPYAHAASHGGRTVEYAPHGEVGLNPKLLVLNPGNPIEVAAEKKLGRKLTKAEHQQLVRAVKEYRTFHGRDPDSIVPVEVPNGTSRFVNLVGDVDRIDYTVKADSARKGKWTHKAGDHGKTAKRTPPALLVSVPGKKAPPVFAQRSGSEMYFKPTHGIMG